MMKMNAKLFLVSVALVLGAGCARPSANSINVDADVNPAVKEAAEKANEYWKAHVAHCGESFYILMGHKLDPNADLMTRLGPEGTMVNVPRQLMELKDVRGRVIEGRVSEAEKMNGLSWRGSNQLVAKVNRKIFLAVQKPEWSQWVDGGASYLEMEKRNGQWSIKPNLWGFPAFEAAPDCGWIARIGEGRTPTKTIATHRLGGEWCGTMGVPTVVDLTVTDVNFTVTTTRESQSGTDVVWFWNQNFVISDIEERRGIGDPPGPPCGSYFFTIRNYDTTGKWGASPIWVNSDRATMEKVRQGILDAQAEWRKKYPH